METQNRKSAGKLTFAAKEKMGILFLMQNYFDWCCVYFLYRTSVTCDYLFILTRHIWKKSWRKSGLTTTRGLTKAPGSWSPSTDTTSRVRKTRRCRPRNSKGVLQCRQCSASRWRQRAGIWATPSPERGFSLDVFPGSFFTNAKCLLCFWVNWINRVCKMFSTTAIVTLMFNKLRFHCLDVFQSRSEKSQKIKPYRNVSFLWFLVCGAQYHIFL